MSRRERKLLRRKGKRYKADRTLEETGPAEKEKRPVQQKKRNKFLDFYEHKYKQAMWVTIVLFIVSLIVIGVHTAMTGEFIPRGVSLKGGVTITVPFEGEIDTDELQAALRAEYSGASISVRAMTQTGEKIGFIVDASDVDSEELLKSTKALVGDFEKFSLETMGSALGQAFFKQILLAILIAFVLMSIVVFLSFKTFVPSAAVIISAIADITMTIAAIDLLGIRVETAGIAALLMLIGYSVDTDILLTTRVVKREEGTVFDRVMNAMKTGLTMTFTSIAAVVIALIFTQSETLRQIMTILLIGLIFDLLNTWIQNAGILRIYMERKSKKRAAETLAEFEDMPHEETHHKEEHHKENVAHHKEHAGHETHHAHHTEHTKHEHR
jgi:preprotein translocase subunit SecF